MNRNLAWRVVVVVAVAIASSGCGKRELTMRYDASFQRMVPIVSAGDTIEWQGITKDKIEWDFAADPCDPSETEKCKIAKGHSGKIFSYKCNQAMPCDPEIAVDDGTGVMPIKGSAPISPRSASGIVAIKAGCTTDGIDLRAERELRVGDVVGWRPVGMVDAKWSVKFDDQMRACGNDAPITHEGGTCKLGYEGDFGYEFTLANNCQGKKSAVMTVVK